MVNWVVQRPNCLENLVAQNGKNVEAFCKQGIYEIIAGIDETDVGRDEEGNGGPEDITLTERRYLVQLDMLFEIADMCQTYDEVVLNMDLRKSVL